LNVNAKMSTILADIRTEYSKQSLNKKEVDKNAIVQFEKWFEEAIQSKVLEPTAVNLATVSSDGKPSARIVLLKGLEDDAFLFYTNYESQKGKELADNPFAALTFFWPELERQVRITGIVGKVSEETSEKYFHSRPRKSQLGAWASKQSTVVKKREIITNFLQKYIAEFAHEVPKPPFWGGYRLIPDTIEFWQGRPSRLHDRIRYTKEADDWIIERLAP